MQASAKIGEVLEELDCRHLLYEGDGNKAPRAPHRTLRWLAHSRRSGYSTAHEGEVDWAANLMEAKGLVFNDA